MALKRQIIRLTKQIHLCFPFTSCSLMALFCFSPFSLEIKIIICDALFFSWAHFIHHIHCPIIMVLVTRIIVLNFIDALNVTVVTYAGVVVMVVAVLVIVDGWWVKAVVPYCLPSFNWSNVLKMIWYTVSINLTQIAICFSSSLHAAVRTSRIASFNS